MVVDAGAGGSLLTTVVDLSVSPPVVVRAGAGETDSFA